MFHFFTFARDMNLNVRRAKWLPSFPGAVAARVPPR
jgi:hypothetical protein